MIRLSPAPRPLDARTALLRCESVSVHRGRRRLLQDVCLAVGPGEALHLTGGNGSGKTSLLRVLAGLARSQRGAVTASGPRAYVPEKLMLASSLRPREWLDAMRRLRGLEPCDWSSAVEASGLEVAALATTSDRLSKGMLQRIALVEALQSACPILLLDEPFEGLDRDGRDWVTRALAEHALSGGAALITDHSGSARERLPGARTLALFDGRCSAAGHVPAASRVRITASNAGGEQLTREVDADRSDAALGDLLATGWHIEKVES